LKTRAPAVALGLSVARLARAGEDAQVVLAAVDVFKFIAQACASG